MTIKNLMVSGEKYTSKTGQEKTRWIKIGVLINKDGKEFIKLDSIPFTNTIQVFEQKEKDELGF
jgi:hypothetical protein